MQHKTDEGRKFGETCAFLHIDNEAPQKKSKKDQKSGNATVAIVRSNQKLRCVSPDVELPKQMVGRTDVGRSIL